MNAEIVNLEIRTALDGILQEATHWKDSTKDLVCFYPMRGSCADGRLMLIGRALYGWGTTPFPAPTMALQDERNKILENTINISSSDVECPIQRLHKLWRDGLPKKGYNPERSSFWCVTRYVTKEFSAPDEKEKWASYLYWTNLYKISPHTKGNPSGSLQKAVGSASRLMLATEIELLRPQRILFLTGKWWADPFLRNSKYVSQETAPYPHVHQIGFWSFDNGSKAAVVVADHPERKRRSSIISEIMDAFSKLGRGSLRDAMPIGLPDAIAEKAG